MRPGYLGSLDEFWFGGFPQFQPIQITPRLQQQRSKRQPRRQPSRQLQQRLPFRRFRQRMVVPRIETLGPVRNSSVER